MKDHFSTNYEITHTPTLIKSENAAAAWYRKRKRTRNARESEEENDLCMDMDI